MKKSYMLAVLSSILMGTVFASTSSDESSSLPVAGIEGQTAAISDPLPGNGATDSSKSRKKILDLVRRGLVMIDVKSFSDILQSERSSHAGTGFIVDREKGIIATNHHVAGDMTVSTYTVKLFDGTSIEAHHIPLQTLADYAFLKVDPTKLPESAVALEFSTEPIAVNQAVYSMGNSARDEFSTFKGTVFSIYENLGPYGDQSFNFSGLTIPGASGSPIFSDDGKVVGILYGGKISSGSGLPISYIEDALKALKRDQVPKMYSTGAILSYGNLSQYQKAGLLSKEAADVYLKKFPDAHNKISIVQGKILGTDAAENLEMGDMIWSINGEMVGPNLYAFDQAIHESKGAEVKLQVYRDGKLLDIPLKTYELKPDAFKKFLSFGDVTWFEANEYVRYIFGEKKPGVFIMGMGPTSPFKAISKTPGGHHFYFGDPRLFKITEIDGKPLHNLDDLKAAIPEISKKETLTVKYIDYVGSTGLGSYDSKDRQEKMGIVSYESKFDSPKLFQFNDKTLEWDTIDLKKEDMPK